MAGLKSPKAGDKLVPVFTADELAALLGTCKGGGIQNRRDYVYQVIERRGRDAGVEVNPRKFRHTFSHVFLDRGGAEGDLMELNGWSSPQMLARYGRSARSARARRHYDDVMGA